MEGLIEVTDSANNIAILRLLGPAPDVDGTWICTTPGRLRFDSGVFQTGHTMPEDTHDLNCLGESKHGERVICFWLQAFYRLWYILLPNFSGTALILPQGVRTMREGKGTWEWLG